MDTEQQFQVGDRVVVPPADAKALDAHDAEVMLKAAKIVCDYCGGRAFESKGEEVPFQYPNDDNWYHRDVSPCKAAAIHRALKRGSK